MGISIRAKQAKQAKSAKEAAKEMALQEMEFTEEKRTADKRREFQLKMEKGKRKLDTKKGKADAAKFSAAMGGLIGPSYRHGHKDLRKNNK